MDFLKLMLEGAPNPNLAGTICFHHVQKYLHLFERLDKTVWMHEESLVRGHETEPPKTTLGLGYTKSH